MRIGLHDADSTAYPNLALAKLSAWHKARGDTVERYIGLMSYDKVYSSKVFTWGARSPYLPTYTEQGGTGYGLTACLPDEIEHTCPDYSLYDYRVRRGKKLIPVSYGFLTRGCIRSCPWCVVPKKEGPIRAHADIEEFCRHDAVVLMDNNILAHDHGIAQIEKMSPMGLRVDFNQGLDARLIDRAIAKRLAALRWLHPIRLACDHRAQMPEVERAVRLLREAGATPKAYSCYVLIKDVGDAEERIMFLQGMGVDPFAQPYRDYSGTEPTQRQKDLARWCNMPGLRRSMPFKDYRPRKTHSSQEAPHAR